MKKIIVLLASFVMMFCALSVQAQDKVATPADAKALLKTLVEYAKANGCEKTFEEINKGTYFKIYKNAYPAVSDFNGVTLANARLPMLTGRSAMDAKDADGKLFIKTGLAKMKKNWNDNSPSPYRWMDSKTNKVEDRTLIGQGFACGGKFGDVSLNITYEGKM